MTHRSPPLPSVWTGALLALGGCGSDRSPPKRTSASPLIVVTERESPEAALQYLHVLPDWPENGKVDYGAAIELGEFVNVRAVFGAVFVYRPEDSTLEKLVVHEDLTVSSEATLSFMAKGVTGWDAEILWHSAERSFMVDEASGQIIRFSPARMEIDGVTDIDESLLERDGLRAQLQQGVCTDSRCFTSVNYRNWETYEFAPGVKLAFFSAHDDSPSFTLLEDDERCASSVALSPFTDAASNVYVVGDGGLGFDLLASPNKTLLPQCVLRVRAGHAEFDPEFFVDVREATGSPAFYTAHPMRDHKLLVNAWSREVQVDSVASSDDPSWYWNYPPYFEYAIVDLESGSSTWLADLPRAAVQFSVTLRVDDTNYVQLYGEDGSTSLKRVDPDGTVSEVLQSGAGTDVQYLGRL